MECSLQNLLAQDSVGTGTRGSPIMSAEKRERNSASYTMEPYSMEPNSLSPAQGNFHQPVFLASH